MFHLSSIRHVSLHFDHAFILSTNLRLKAGAVTHLALPRSASLSRNKLPQQIKKQCEAALIPIITLQQTTIISAITNFSSVSNVSPSTHPSQSARTQPAGLQGLQACAPMKNMPGQQHHTNCQFARDFTARSLLPDQNSAPSLSAQPHLPEHQINTAQVVQAVAQ